MNPRLGKRASILTRDKLPAGKGGCGSVWACVSWAAARCSARMLLLLIPAVLDDNVIGKHVQIDAPHLNALTESPGAELFRRNWSPTLIFFFFILTNASIRNNKCTRNVYINYRSWSVLWNVSVNSLTRRWVGGHSWFTSLRYRSPELQLLTFNKQTYAVLCTQRIPFNLICIYPLTLYILKSSSSWGSWLLIYTNRQHKTAQTNHKRKSTFGLIYHHPL